MEGGTKSSSSANLLQNVERLVRAEEICSLGNARTGSWLVVPRNSGLYNSLLFVQLLARFSELKRDARGV